MERIIEDYKFSIQQAFYAVMSEDKENELYHYGIYRGISLAIDEIGTKELQNQRDAAWEIMYNMGYISSI